MLKLEDEKKRLAEFEAEYERKKDVYGGQMILGQVVELRRIVSVLEKGEEETTKFIKFIEERQLTENE